MSRYIDKDEFIKSEIERCGCVPVIGSCTADSALTCIAEGKEVKPVKPLEDLRPKGKWIGLEYDGYADGNPVYDLWECSNCGNEEKGEDVPEQNPFCRCCGAKMEA